MRRILALPWYFRVPLLLVLAAAIGTVVGLAVSALSLHVKVKGQPLTWVDWTTAIGLPVAVVGVGITWLQVLQTRTAAEEASAAVDRALTALGKSELLVDFQTMRQLEYDFDGAKTASPEVVQGLIKQVREVGSRIAATLRQKDPNDALIGEIEAVRQTASDARVVIMGGRKNLNLWSVTRKLREELVPLCDKISTRMHNLRLEVGSEFDGNE